MFRYDHPEPAARTRGEGAAAQTLKVANASEAMSNVDISTYVKKS